jgi:hypothetical protein
MVQDFAQALMGAETEALCGAGYGERSRAPAKVRATSALLGARVDPASTCSVGGNDNFIGDRSGVAAAVRRRVFPQGSPVESNRVERGATNERVKPTSLRPTLIRCNWLIRVEFHST